MPSAVSAFADWATGVSDDHGDEAYRRVRAGCIDTVACLVAGARDPAGIAAREAIAGDRFLDFMARKEAGWDSTAD